MRINVAEKPISVGSVSGPLTQSSLIFDATYAFYVLVFSLASLDAARAGRIIPDVPSGLVSIALILGVAAVADRAVRRASGTRYILVSAFAFFGVCFVLSYVYVSAYRGGSVEYPSAWKQLWLIAGGVALSPTLIGMMHRKAATTTVHEMNDKNAPPSARVNETGARQALGVGKDETFAWDVFISHASEDKVAVARPLSLKLQSMGLRVWLDENELRLGDSLSRKIDQGLAGSRFGVVILSSYFLTKEWPEAELAGMVSRQRSGEKVILPVWHQLDRAFVMKYSPTLADYLATNTKDGLDKVAEDILRVVRP